MNSATRLTVADAEAYMELRRLSLIESPWAFGSSPEDDRMRDPAAVSRSLSEPDQAVFAVRDAADAGRLVAAAGVMRETKNKRRHIASIYGVYTRPEARGFGLGRTVTVAAIDTAREWVNPSLACIELSVTDTSEGGTKPSPAYCLYESLGFVAWGLEPDAIRLPDGRTFDELHMRLVLAPG